MVQELISRFGRTDGIKTLWDKTLFLPEKELLFDKESLFHVPEVYNHLAELAEEAKRELTVQKNFVEYCHMLFYGATEFVDWATPEEVKELIKIDEFRNIIWSAVTAKPLNGRTVGDLEGYRQKLLNGLFGGDESALLTPNWWRDVIKVFRDRKTTEQATVTV